MTTWTPGLEGRTGPRYLAIAEALADDIAAGRLRPGTRLPTHRDLAYRLGVTTGTVTRAYAEAERRGLISGTVGRGTYVLDRAEQPSELIFASSESAPDGQIDLSSSQPAQVGQESVLGEALKQLGGQPNLGRLSAYQPHAGLPAHREAGARWLERWGLPVSPDNVIVTSGVQNGIALSLLAASTPGGTVLVEEMTYPGIKAVAASLNLQLHPIAMDAQGALPEAFQAACHAVRPQVFYITPTLHNPTTAIMPDDRRRRIIEIAREHNVLLIEDDVFRFLSPDAPPPLAALAPDITINLTSLTKSFAPGLRLGYAAVPSHLLDRFRQAIRATALMTSPLLAELGRLLIESGEAERVADSLRQDVLARQEVARSVLGAHAAAMPAGAMHLWLRLPDPWRPSDFTGELLRRGVETVPADAFVTGRASAPLAVRISLTKPSRQDLRRGLEIVAEVLENPGALLLSVV